ncbi:MAG TPA: TRAP transporter large permease subunit [Rhodopila sp.]|jgi:tripartite ATP-independent transporter DctM subunit|nr:TRAP transporter large permease subunit [Rhodopila sp.]
MTSATVTAPSVIPNGAARLVSRTVRGIALLATTIAATALLIELVVVLVSIIGRSTIGHGPLWSDEASRLALSIIAFIGGAAAYRGAHHTAIRLVTDRLSETMRLAVGAGIEWLVLIVTAATAWQSVGLLTASWDNVTPILQISTGWTTLPVTFGLLLIALFALERLLVGYTWRMVAVTGIVMASATVLAAIEAGASTFADNPGASLTGMILLFFGAILLGMPVSFGMLFATISYLDLTDTAPLVAVPQAMVDGTGNFILLALPFFIFAGLIMERGGISLRLVRFAMAIIGNVRGGLLQVVVVTIFLVSGVSGSKVADVAAVGPVVRRELKRQGYRESEGAAVLAASAAMGETIPPSIAMLVLGSVTPISIGTLFIAGILPAVVMALCLMTLIYVLARRTPRRDDIRIEGGRLRAIPGAILPLIMPVAMVLGIKFGFATPTEASSLAVVYGLTLSALVYRALPVRTALGLAGECANSAGMVLFVLSSASAFAWVLTAANLPQALVVLLGAMGGGQWAFMAGSVVLLIVIGSLLEGLPALIILAPLLLPIAVHMGVDAVQYGIVLILAMGVGAFIPPIGVGFYVSAAVAGADIESAARTMIPYAVVLVLAVLLIAFVPDITLVLPRLLEGHG